MTIIQHTWQKWSWRVVGCVSTPHQHSHQVKPLVLVVNHCLALLLIDRVVYVLSQSICVWMIHHCDTLLNATQCGHVCHHLPCEPKWHCVTTSPLVHHHAIHALSHKAWCCVCCVVTPCLLRPLTLWHGQSPPPLHDWLLVFVVHPPNQCRYTQTVW